MSRRDVTTPRLTAIAAVADNGVIGDGTSLPWHLPEDFARFKRVTMGGVLVIGRRTYESLPGPLLGRLVIVLTHTASWQPTPRPGETVQVATSGTEEPNSLVVLGHLLASHADREWWSAGGGGVYRALWPYTTHLDLTAVHARPEGHVTFPEVDPSSWRLTAREPHAGFDFVSYVRTDLRAAQALEGLTRRA